MIKHQIEFLGRNRRLFAEFKIIFSSKVPFSLFNLKDIKALAGHKGPVSNFLRARIC